MIALFPFKPRSTPPGQPLSPNWVQMVSAQLDVFFPSVHLKCHQPVQQPTVVTGQCYCHYLLLLGMSGGYVLSQVKLYVSSGFSLCACNGSLELCSISAYTACLSIKRSHGGRDRRGSTLVLGLPYCPLPRKQAPLVQAGSGRR